MTAEDCLPPWLRGAATTITPLVAGLSGAGVFRVDTHDGAFVLKIASDAEGTPDWRRALATQRLAAEAGIAPRIIHVDEARRAVVTALVVDRSFADFFRDPRTHDDALALLGGTVRRLHALPLPPDAAERDPWEFLAQMRGGPLGDFAFPAFADAAITRALDGAAPRERAVLGHNDLNPGNLVYDGASILVLDWATAGAADPRYDLATLAVFLRMDDADALGLLSAYEGEAVAAVPEGFRALTRLVAALAGTMQLHIARQMGHAGATGTESINDAPTLAAFYQAMREGTLRLGTREGQWAFGLALLRESLAR